jgi:hypothetical protein
VSKLSSVFVCMLSVKPNRPLELNPHTLNHTRSSVNAT